MADVYRIKKTTLDAIGNSIRAKTSKSALIPPDDMPEEIESIETGGGFELIAEATTTEDVEAFRVDVPAEKQNMAAYIVEYDCTFVGGAKYACPRLNSISHGVPYTPQSSTAKYSVGIARAYSGNYNMLITDGGVWPTRSAVSAVEYVAMVGYYAGNLVAAGSTIKVYGIGEPT